MSPIRIFFRLSPTTCASPNPASATCAHRSPLAASAIAVLARWSSATAWRSFSHCVKTIWQQSEALAREQVARIKPGKYEAEALFDSDGVNLDRPVPLKVKVEVAGGDMTIDFSEISDQVPGSINSGESGAVAAARVAFKSLVSPVLADRRRLLSSLEGCHSRRERF